MNLHFNEVEYNKSNKGFEKVWNTFWCKMLPKMNLKIFGRNSWEGDIELEELCPDFDLQLSIGNVSHSSVSAHQQS